ncbi:MULTISPECIES: zinc ribbon domain-containing protein [Arthrobacter]|uniref:Zinc ribbon domain-containing protein n=1 Tax=Arthrobacter terricola TaxID=2547396 RepID=A0A4R5KNM2_9MICC|nr:MULTISPECIES: zinc ribbon domain-containing protein [Arthrobacter]MBT8160998.1 zinc ribbon domain-containing protein [Arthrobacter sp. GN70]TDF96862.1 zinc ribbon domain-containing protein [Arthrobacter terricola]
MAFTTDGESIAISIPFTKSEEAADGSVYVEGICTDDGLDLDSQIVDRDFATKGLTVWFEDWGNCRQMHSSNLAPAGKAVKMEVRPEGIWVRTHVVEPTAVKLVKEGVYKAYSVGISKPRIIRDPDGIAKNGRVVDGIFSEISLVDFPANPRSRFDLAKRASSGEIEVVEKAVEVELTKAAPTPADVFGDKASEGDSVPQPAEVPAAEKATDADTAPVEPEVTKGSRDCTNCGATHHADSAAKFCADCGSKLPGKTEKAEEPEVSKAADAKEPDGDEDGADTDGDGDGKPDADDDKAEKSVVPLHVKRLHDALCAAFHEEDVLNVHPVVAKGLPGLVEPAVWAADVSKAIAAEDIAGMVRLSEGYGLALQLAKADEAACGTAMDGLRKSFADAFPDAHPTPGDVEPGKFKRPYISAGRVNPTAAPGQHPRIPLASHVPTPKAAEADLTKGVVEDQAADILKSFHDFIADQHADMCPMFPEPGVLPTPAPATTDALDTRATATPQPVTPPNYGDVRKGLGLAAEESLDDRITSLLGKAIEKAQKPLQDENSSLREEVETLTKRITSLESAPDPSDRAYRGGALAALRPSVEKGAAGSVDTEAAEALRAIILKARHPRSDISGPAMDSLIKVVGPKRAADLVSD